MSDLDLSPALAPYRNLIGQLLPKDNDCCCEPESRGPVIFDSHGNSGGEGPVTNRKVIKKKCPVATATAAAVGLISVKQVALRVPNERLRAEMIASVDAALVALVDDYCGTPPHPHWLGSQADIVTLVGNLGATAETYSNAAMREGILDVAALVAIKGASVNAKGREG